MNEHRLNRFDGSIYLTGFMASGKSTAGKKLSALLDKPFRDLDEEISIREHKSIRKIFEENGEAYFREAEWKYLLDLTRNFKGIVSLGGGALQSQAVVDHLKVNGLLVFLDTPLDEILNRVYRNTRRPIVFNDKGDRKSKETLYNELKTLYSNRIDFYRQAPVRIQTHTYSSNDEMVQALLQKIQQHV